jgi:hypothetical protein
VEEGHDGAKGELPFKAQPDIDEDAKTGQHKRDQRLLDKFAGHRCANDLGSADLDIVAERAL